MSTLHQTVSRSRSASAGWHRLAEEATALCDALLHPTKLVAEVEQMRQLQLQADRIEATDPARAAVLRQRAARILS